MPAYARWPRNSPVIGFADPGVVGGFVRPTLRAAAGRTPRNRVRGPCFLRCPRVALERRRGTRAFPMELRFFWGNVSRIEVATISPPFSEFQPEFQMQIKLN